MAKTRRSPSRSGKKSRGVLWLIAGLLLGAALMWGAQRYYYRDSKPFSGFANLFSSSKKPAEISNTAGKQQLSQEILNEIKQSLSSEEFQEDVLDVLFTSFVIQ